MYSSSNGGGFEQRSFETGRGDLAAPIPVQGRRPAPLVVNTGYEAADNAQFNLAQASGLETPINTNSTATAYMYLNEQGKDSTLSLASSTSEVIGSGAVGAARQQQQQQFIANSSSQLSSAFVNLLMELYQFISADPSLTPFDVTNPPSGILNKVAKLSIEEAQRRNVEIGFDKNNWLLSLIRYRLQQEIRNEFSRSRSSSVSSLLPMPTNFNELLTMNASNPSNFQPSVTTPGLQPAMDYFSKPNTINTQDLLLNSSYSPIYSSSRTNFGTSSTALNSASGSNLHSTLNRTRSNSAQFHLNTKPSLSRSNSNTYFNQR